MVRRTVGPWRGATDVPGALLRDAAYAIPGSSPRISGDEGFALGFRFLLWRAVAIGQRRDALKDSTLAQYDQTH
jgi:hypothetical protein